jgi:hypothetical protein
MIYIEDLNILYNFLEEYHFTYDSDLDIWYKNYIIYLDKNDKSKSQLIIEIKNDKCIYYQISKKYGKYHDHNISNVNEILRYMSFLNSFSRYNKIKNLLQ